MIPTCEHRHPYPAGWHRALDSERQAQWPAYCTPCPKCNPYVEELQKRIRFYESILSKQRPHQAGERRCKIAEQHGLGCCNPACNGHWGTGCWCCHSLGFAAEFEQQDIDAHLALIDKKAP
jgi:hypothetical protein